MKKTVTWLFSLLFGTGLFAQQSVQTEKQYLSGTGCDDMEIGRASCRERV